MSMHNMQINLEALTFSVCSMEARSADALRPWSVWRTAYKLYIILLVRNHSLSTPSYDPGVGVITRLNLCYTTWYHGITCQWSE